MALPGFFKQHQHRKFEYEPVYYDERSERMKERLENAEKSKSPKESGDYIPNIKGKIKNHYNLSSTVGKQRKASNLRLIIIIVILSAAAYYLFKF